MAVIAFPALLAGLHHSRESEMMDTSSCWHSRTRRWLMSHRLKKGSPSTDLTSTKGATPYRHIQVQVHPNTAPKCSFTEHRPCLHPHPPPHSTSTPSLLTLASIHHCHSYTCPPFHKGGFQRVCKYHTVKPPNPGVDGLGIIHHSFSAVEVEAEEPLSDLSGITQKAYKRIRIITQIFGLTSLF